MTPTSSGEQPRPRPEMTPERKKYLDDLVARWPDFTDEQRQNLARMLRPQVAAARARAIDAADLAPRRRPR